MFSLSLMGRFWIRFWLCILSLVLIGYLSMPSLTVLLLLTLLTLTIRDPDHARCVTCGCKEETCAAGELMRRARESAECALPCEHCSKHGTEKKEEPKP